MPVVYTEKKNSYLRAADAGGCTVLGSKNAVHVNCFLYSYCTIVKGTQTCFLASTGLAKTAHLSS
jgi:hypothetical protein